MQTEKNKCLRMLTLLGNVANQLYYPAEHIAWLADMKVINTDSKKWWRLGIYLWALSLFAEILKNLVIISRTRTKLKKATKQQYLQSSHESEEPGENTEVKALRVKLMESQLSLVQATADFINAINWCPSGVLWAGKFSRSFSGFFGIISTSIMLYKAWPTKQ